MRILKIMLLSFGVLATVACTDDETSIEKYYEGNWTIQTSDPQIDSVTNIFISAEGNFAYDMNYGGGTIKVNGIVKNTGELRADLTLDTLLLGINRGRLHIDGQGSGEYTIVNQKFEWTATKK